MVLVGQCNEWRDQARAAAESEAATAREDSLRQARADSVRAYQALTPDERARVDSLARAAAARADSLRQVAAAREDSVRRAREAALADSLQGWIRGGGGVNPLGQSEPVMYLRAGHAAERIPFPGSARTRPGARFDPEPDNRHVSRNGTPSSPTHGATSSRSVRRPGRAGRRSTRRRSSAFPPIADPRCRPDRSTRSTSSSHRGGCMSRLRPP